MRESIATALKDAQKGRDKTRVSTLRLMQAAIHDRDIANRGTGKDPISDDEVLLILARMIKQREESARAFEDGGRIELAEEERAEIEIIREFLPEQLCEEDMARVCREVVGEVNAEGLRDMGKCMSVLKERYAGQMDFSEASGVVKSLLR